MIVTAPWIISLKMLSERERERERERESVENPNGLQLWRYILVWKTLKRVRYEVKKQPTHPPKKTNNKTQTHIPSHRIFWVLQHVPRTGAESEFWPQCPTKERPASRTTHSQAVEVGVRSVFQSPPRTYFPFWRLILMVVIEICLHLLSCTEPGSQRTLLVQQWSLLSRWFWLMKRLFWSYFNNLCDTLQPRAWCLN